MWVETQPSGQSSIQKLNVDNSCQKTRKIRHYIFDVLSNIHRISLDYAKYFGQECLRKQIFGRSTAQSPSSMNFWMSSVTSKHFSNNHVNIKQVNSIKSSKLNGFTLAVFCVLGLG